MNDDAWSAMIAIANQPAVIQPVAPAAPVVPPAQVIPPVPPAVAVAPPQFIPPAAPAQPAAPMAPLQQINGPWYENQDILPNVSQSALINFFLCHIIGSIFGNRQHNDPVFWMFFGSARSGKSSFITTACNAVSTKAWFTVAQAFHGNETGTQEPRIYPLVRGPPNHPTAGVQQGNTNNINLLDTPGITVASSPSLWTSIKMFVTNPVGFIFSVKQEDQILYYMAHGFRMPWSLKKHAPNLVFFVVRSTNLAEDTAMFEKIVAKLRAHSNLLENRLCVLITNKNNMPQKLPEAFAQFGGRIFTVENWWKAHPAVAQPVVSEDQARHATLLELFKMLYLQEETLQQRDIPMLPWSFIISYYCGMILRMVLYLVVMRVLFASIVHMMHIFAESDWVVRLAGTDREL